ncbi:MAG TPA: hypothetical protein VM580_27920 [Labilithrix sp.]|nr:hypothetical protein [Labilithrix sp.]
MTVKKTALAIAAIGAVAACSAHADDHGAPDLTVTISGEGAALTGFAFPPSSSNDLAFVDGWDVKFDRILVTVDDIVLNDHPDMNPTDQSQVGRVVATAKGPWAVDMTKPGAITDIKPTTKAQPLTDGLGVAYDHDHEVGAAGKDPHAQPLARFDALDDSRPFDPAQRYAFGFDIVTASDAAKHTNLDAAAEADYAEMRAKGLSVLYVGTATFKGVDCKSSNPDYKFEALPKTVKFRFGFKTPTKYKNCQNTDLRGKPFDGEESQRGVQVNEHGGTIAQITLHVDHPFWSTVDHDRAELFFDQMAAVASPDGTLVIDDLAKVDFTAFKDASGNALPWRSCVANKPVKPGVRRFDAGNVAVNPIGAPESALRNYADFVSYQQSTQGHLNAAGLCAVARQFPAPR